MPARVDPQSVFLNVPFGRSYERFFVALVASLVSVGRKPRCALEVSAPGRNRLDRIFDLLRSCRVSVHDLSSVGLPVRFNMAFEIGLACALARLHGPHDFILLERQANRLDRTLSDMKGWDPMVYGGSVRALENCVLGSLPSRRGDADPARVHRVSRRLWRVAGIEKGQRRADSIYHPAIFRILVSAAGELAVKEGLILT